MAQMIVLSCDVDGLTGGHQMSIGIEDEKGSGHGYRLHGPKYSGTGKRLVRAVLDERDAREIRHYLDMVFPVTSDG